jgi:hypothetical protein
MCLVCLIPDLYVGMLSPVLGPAVLHLGAEWQLAMSAHWKSNFGLTFDTHLVSGLVLGAPKRTYVWCSFKRLTSFAPMNEESTWFNEEKPSTGKHCSSIECN